MEEVIQFVDQKIQHYQECLFLPNEELLKLADFVHLLSEIEKANMAKVKNYEQSGKTTDK